MSLFFDPIVMWLIVTRLSGWMVLAPGFTEINTPMVVRAFFLIWLSVLMMPLIGPVTIHIYSLLDLVMVMLTEFMIGAGYGLMLRLIFAGIYFGGVLVDGELGLLAAQQLNPFAPQSSGFFSRLFLLVSILFFWLEDYFRIIILALRESFLLIPLGTLSEPHFDMAMFIRLGAGIFIGGLAFAAPIMALMFFVNITLGFLARAVHGINIFAEGFIIKIIVGFIGVFYFMQLMFRFVRLQLDATIPMSHKYFHTLMNAVGA